MPPEDTQTERQVLPVHAITTARQFIKDREYALAAAAMPVVWGIQSALSAPLAYASGSIKVPKVSVGNDGTVKLGDGASGTDVKGAFNTLIGNSQFVLGAIVTVASLIVLGFGLWKAKDAAKQLQENSQMGWQSAGAILKGTIVGGILFATIGIILAASATTGANLFSSGG